MRIFKLKILCYENREPRWAPKLSYDLSTSMAVTRHVTLIWNYKRLFFSCYLGVFVILICSGNYKNACFPNTIFFFFNERCYKYVWWLRWNYLLFHLSPVDGNATKIIFPCSRHHHPQKNWLSVKLFYSNGQCCGYTIKQLQTEKTQNNQHREKRNKKIYICEKGEIYFKIN